MAPFRNCKKLTILNLLKIHCTFEGIPKTMYSISKGKAIKIAKILKIKTKAMEKGSERLKFKLQYWMKCEINPSYWVKIDFTGAKQ